MTEPPNDPSPRSDMGADGADLDSGVSGEGTATESTRISEPERGHAGRMNRASGAGSWWAAVVGNEAGGPRKRPGVRLGPIYFVPQFRRLKGNDPWAHRKGEPRPFALLWAMYLMVGALLTIFAVRSLTVPSLSQFQSGCRAMLVVMVAGICILWPMTRLSQRSPERVFRSLLIDSVVLLTPVQAVLWPMPLLTRWGWDVLTALDLTLIGWTLLVAAMIGYALGMRRAISRTLWMVAFVGVVGLGPTLTMAIASTGRPPPTQALAWLSPLTSVYRLTAAPSGVHASMTASEWALALAPLSIAGLLWSLALLTPHPSPPLPPTYPLKPPPRSSPPLPAPSAIPHPPHPPSS